MTSNEYVIKAVNLGEDTDTIAAIAGGVAAIHYGFDTIPPKWLSVIPKAMEIDAICETLGKTFK